MAKTEADNADVAGRSGDPDLPPPARFNLAAVLAVRDVLRKLRAQVEVGEERRETPPTRDGVGRSASDRADGSAE